MFFRPLLPWQEQVEKELRRFNVFNCGRRTGKSSFCEEKLGETALEGDPAGYFAPTFRDTRNMWESLKIRLDPVIDRTDESEHTMWLTTAGRIECWSHDNPRNGRGRKYKRVVVDEFRDFPNQRESWERTIRLTLSDYKGDAFFASTPNGMDLFHELYIRGDKSRLQPDQRDQYPDWMSWTFPTSANPYIEPEEIEQMRLEMTAESFDQEVLAKFIADGGAVFKPIDISAVEQKFPIAGHAYVIGVDFGKSNDFSVFAVYDATLKAIVHVDRSNNLDLTFQCKRLKELSTKFKPSVILAEENTIGIALLEILRGMQLPVRSFLTSNQSKARIVENMQLAIENQRISFYPNLHIEHEFASFAKERLPSGLIRYAAPQGYHDDIVMACCIALDAAETGVPKWEALYIAV